MTLEKLHQFLITASESKTDEYTRLFHGRGHTYGDYAFLTIDSTGHVLFAIFFDADEEEEAIIKILKDLYANEKKWQALIVQRRYLSGAPSEIIEGALPPETYAIEKSLRYHLNFLNAQNIGFFPDMQIGRSFVRENANGKKVLNLFSYTCSFSVAAMMGGAESVVNVDMNSNVLSIGRQNHRINAIDTKKVQFLPHNILKSWGRIRRDGPYELIIIDPPSFQKGSFAATNDYVKIIRRLHEFAAPECTVLAALNAPELDTAFLMALFAENAPDFHFVKRLENPNTFPEIDPERSLKNLIFKKRAE